MACGADKKWVSLRKRHTGGARRTGPQHVGLPPPVALSGLSFLPSLPPRVDGQALHAVAFRFELGQHPSLSSCDARANLGRVKELKRSKAYPRGCVFGNSLGPTPLGDLRGTKDSGPKGRDRKRAASPGHGGEARMDAKLFRGTAAPRRPAPLSSRVGPTATLMGVVGDQPSWVVFGPKPSKNRLLAFSVRDALRRRPGTKGRKTRVNPAGWESGG